MAYFKSYLLIMSLFSVALISASEPTQVSHGDKNSNFDFLNYVYNNWNSNSNNNGMPYSGKADDWFMSAQMLKRVIEINNYKLAPKELETTLLIVKQSKSCSLPS